MDSQLESIVRALQADFGAGLEEFRGEAHLTVLPQHIHAVVGKCRDEGFELLSALTAVDYWPQTSPRFHVIYHLRSLARDLSLLVRVPVDEGRPEVPTVSDLYASAVWRERELWDMFGIRVTGHPDPRRILMPPDYEGHPLRKDHPLGYEEPQFSFNFDEIGLRKPSPKE